MAEMKLGVAGPKQDVRTLKLMTVLKELPPIPDVFDVDNLYPGIKIPTPMYKNDVYGDCVIAGRAHQTLRFEAYEQNQLITITDKNVTDEYFSESGGQDSGLYIIDSLRWWRNNGWKIGGVSQIIKVHGCWRKLKPKPTPPVSTNVYSIYAFGAIDPKNHDDVKAVCYLLNGVYVGVALPNTAKNQPIWEVVGDPEKDENSKRWSWGGHCVYVKAYNEIGPVCVTWGRIQQMTWRWFDVYCFDCFGVVDNKNAFTQNSPVDVNKLDKYLQEIAA